MSVNAHIYANNGAGGPVNQATPIGTATGTTFQPPALALSSDNTFLVRNFDTVSGLEEQNVDARIRIIIDAAGNDITARPNAPSGLTAVPLAAGSVRVSWQYNAGGQGGPPVGFHVYAGTPTPNYGAVLQTVPYAKNRYRFSCTLTGLTSGTTYEISVRAYNATAEEPNTNVVSVVPDSAGPAAVDSFTVTAVT